MYMHNLKQKKLKAEVVQIDIYLTRTIKTSTTTFLIPNLSLNKAVHITKNPISGNFCDSSWEDSDKRIEDVNCR